MKLIVALALVAWLLPSPVVAQGALVGSLNVLTQVDRERGTFTSVAYTVPLEAEEIHVRLNMPTADYEDSARRSP